MHGRFLAALAGQAWNMLRSRVGICHHREDGHMSMIKLDPIGRSQPY